MTKEILYFFAMLAILNLETMQSYWTLSRDRRKRVRLRHSIEDHTYHHAPIPFPQILTVDSDIFTVYLKGSTGATTVMLDMRSLVFLDPRIPDFYTAIQPRVLFPTMSLLRIHQRHTKPGQVRNREGEMPTGC